MNDEKLIEAVKIIISEIGEDLNRAGLQDTPKRVAKALRESLRGYEPYPFEFTAFPSSYDQLIIRKGIPFASTCEHHLSYYGGKIDFAYIPNGKVVGISKIIRLIQHHSARLTIQEDLTKSLLLEFDKRVEPLGSVIKVSALHTCESARGVNTHGVPTETMAFTGVFAKDRELLDRFISLINQ